MNEIGSDAASMGAAASELLRACEPWTKEEIERVRELAGQRKTDDEIAAILRRTRTAIGSIRGKNGIRCGRIIPRRDGPPAEFKEIAPSLSLDEARNRWKTSWPTLREWYAKFGLQPRARKYPNGSRVGQRVAPPPPVERKTGRFVLFKRRPQENALPKRDDTVTGRAVLHLQRKGPVFRARTIDPSADIDTWIVNGRRVSEAEMIALAERRGFQRNPFASLTGARSEAA